LASMMSPPVSFTQPNMTALIRTKGARVDIFSRARCPEKYSTLALL
jgi:hypothetical protein